MRARALVALAAVALVPAGCVQDYICPYYCGASIYPTGDVHESGGDVDSVNARCEKDRASSCAPDAGPVRCDCNPTSPDLSPGTNSPSSPR